LRIEDCSITQVGKIKYRKYVTEACRILNEDTMLQNKSVLELPMSGMARKAI
jgi:hypothetical protein